MHSVLSLLAALVAAPLLSTAVPLVQTRAAGSDLTVLTFASVLEAMETKFYTGALSKFQSSDYLAAGYSNPALPIQQIQNIMSDEASHLKTLDSSIVALGGKTPQGCIFDFSGALTDVDTMVTAARVVEFVGVSAYLGAAHLISDVRILEAAASIMTVESRHQTIMNIISGTGSAIPQDFDIPMSPSEALAIAGKFISGCDTGIMSNIPLSVTNTGTPSPGTLLTFSWQGMPPDTSGLNCQMMIGGAVDSISLPLSGCVVPATVNGPVAIWITNSTQPLLNNVIDRSTAQNVAGPTLAFIDAKPEDLGEIIRAGSSSNTSTATDASPSSAPPSSSSGPNLATGPGADGATVVNGWTNLPPTA